MKLYRDWHLSGDTDWLRELWPYAKRSIEYAWSPDNPDRWDPDQTGVLWGRQHHTLDMELFGPNSWLTGFYLGALDAGARMAEAVGEPAFADELRGDPRARPATGSTSTCSTASTSSSAIDLRTGRSCARSSRASAPSASSAMASRASTGAPSTSSSSTSWATAA